MKAKDSFTIFVDKDGGIVAEGESISVKVGDDIDTKLKPATVHDLLVRLPDFLDVKREGNWCILTPEQQERYDYHPQPVPESAKVMSLPRRKYSQDKLWEIWNKDKMTGLKEVAKELELKITKKVTGARLITLILKTQEENRRH